MAQRLVWNFEFIPSHFSFSDLTNQKEDSLKWESRCFWPESDIIQLALLDSSLLELINYQYKQKSDVYYLIPKGPYNIKKRRDELLYKPIIKQNKRSIGYGSKINLIDIDKMPTDFEFTLDELSEHVQHSEKVLVNKESFVYKFPTQPHIKLELSRIQFNDTLYFSACVEGKSRNLVETISQHLWGKQSILDYISFLKKVTHK